jgi:hypothetical protein
MQLRFHSSNPASIRRRQLHWICLQEAAGSCIRTTMQPCDASATALQFLRVVQLVWVCDLPVLLLASHPK